MPKIRAFARLARRALPAALALLALSSTSPQALAGEKFVYLTNWYAQAEHGGFYQALATGLYKQLGLDVTIRMGGPQVNILQLLAAGQADCVMGSSDVQILQARDNGLPVQTVAAVFQKDPQVLIAHEDVKSFEQMRGKTLLIASSALQGYWPWLKARFGFNDAQMRPYTFNIQPFMADPNAVQQGYLTSEPFAIQKAGGRINTFLFSEHGYPTYSTTISCMEKTVKERRAAVAAFVRATAEGWKSYLANPAPGNALIKKDNPNISDEQLAYSVAKLKQYGIVDGGDAPSLGLLVMTPARLQASYDVAVATKLINPAKVPLASSYSTEFVKDLRVMP